jgi:hypothetical protein
MRDKKAYAIRDKMKAAQNNSNFNEFSAPEARYGMTFTATHTVRTTTLPPMLYDPAARVGKQ